MPFVSYVLNQHKNLMFACISPSFLGLLKNQQIPE